MDATGRWCSIVVGYAELEAHWATPLSLEVAMLPTGVKETQLRESNSQKVHPQPMEEATNQTPEALEALISRIFMNISPLRTEGPFWT